jgi:uracil-DNA glycosylase family 4
MSGFFTKQETASQSRPDGKKLSCISCGGYQWCNTPKMEVFGEGKKGIMVIGPGIKKTDDKNGMPFQGLSGKILSNAFKKHHVDLWEDCVLLNVTRCHFTSEGESRNPNNNEIQCCRKYVLQAIEKYKPKLIFLLGQEALYSVIGHRWKKDLETIDKWRGWTIPDQDFQAWICPIFDPLYVENPKKPEIATVWKLDIANAMEKLDSDFPMFIEPTIQYHENLNFLSDLENSSQKVVAFDYETTGLKPHAEGHKIICCSIAIHPDHVHVFMMPQTKKEQEPFVHFLENKRIRKYAQNMKFEDTWSNVILGANVQGWQLDTMLVSHIFDNRAGVTGLKFQTYVQFGIIDYDSEVNPYLRAVNNDDANSLNRIEELLKQPSGEHKLLKYCAMDSIFEFRLAEKQLQIIADL